MVIWICVTFFPDGSTISSFGTASKDHPDHSLPTAQMPPRAKDRMSRKMVNDEKRTAIFHLLIRAYFAHW